MQRSERQIQLRIGENVIFDSSSFNSNSEFQNDAQITRIMDIPGTAHEKIVILAEME